MPRAAGQEEHRAPVRRGSQRFFDHMCDPVGVRTAYRCRAYPDEAQQAVLRRTFGCVRVVWNRTLAARQRPLAPEGKGTSYAESDRALTAMKKDPDLAFLSEVSSVPLQQALRHQHEAFTAFFARRARYPRFKSRRSRQSAHYTRSAFTMRGRDAAAGQDGGAAAVRLVLAGGGRDRARPGDGDRLAGAGRTLVRDLHRRRRRPGPLAETGRAVGVDLGVKDFAVTSDGERIANPRHLERKARRLARYQRAPGPLPERIGQPGQGGGQGRPGAPQGPQRAAGLPAPHQHPPGPLG